MTQPIALPITGSVDPALLAGLVTLATNLTNAGNASEDAGKKAEQAGGRWATGIDTVRRSAQAFNEVRAAVGGAVAGFVETAERVAALSTEQERLTRMSQRLGLDFDEAAESAGRFADETEAMSAAGRFAAADIRLTQTELNALLRVAGSASETLGTDTAGAVQQLQEALIRGREGGLQRFGSALADVAGEGHTVQERLAALVRQAREVATATDTAADRMARYRDSLEDAQRTAASAFTQEIAQLATVRRESDGIAASADDLNTKMRAVGQTAAYVLTQVQNVAGVVVGVVGATLAPLLTALDVAVAGLSAIENGPRSAAAAMAAAAQGDRFGGALRFARDSARDFAAAYRESNRERTTADPGADTAPLADANRAARGADMVFTESEARANERDRRAGGRRRDRAADMTFTDAEAANVERGGSGTRQEVAFEELMGRVPQERAADAVAAGQRETALQAEHLRQQGAERATQETLRNKRDLEARLEDHRSYNGQLREIYGEQINLAQGAADSTSKAFGALGTAIGDHIQALAAGRENVAEALQGVLADTLAAIAKEASVKGALYFAEGLGHLAIYDYPGAGQAFGASAAFFAVSAAAGVGAAALAPPQPSNARGAGGGARGEGGTSGLLPERARRDGEGGMVINVNFGGSTIIGRGGARQAAHEIASVLNEGAVQGGVQLVPAAVAGWRR